MEDFVPGKILRLSFTKSKSPGRPIVTNPTLWRPLPTPRARDLGGCRFSPGFRGHVGKGGARVCHRRRHLRPLPAAVGAQARVRRSPSLPQLGEPRPE